MFRGCKASKKNKYIDKSVTNLQPISIETQTDYQITTYLTQPLSIQNPFSTTFTTSYPDIQDSFSDLRNSISNMKINISNLEKSSFNTSMSLSNTIQTVHQLTTSDIPLSSQIQRSTIRELSNSHSNSNSTLNSSSKSLRTAFSAQNLSLHLSKTEANKVQRKLFKISQNIHKNVDFEPNIDIQKPDSQPTEMGKSFQGIMVQNLEIIQNDWKRDLFKYLGQQFENIIKGQDLEYFNGFSNITTLSQIQQAVDIVQKFDISIFNGLSCFDKFTMKVKLLTTKIYLLEDRTVQAAESILMMQDGVVPNYGCQGEFLEGLNLEQRQLDIDLKELNVVNIDKLWGRK
ncbi:hypothetical protein SS50377_27567 [Spironucleus salmonicida]|uniref:Uncharacterized protein n=1 Tax=Spironucleus salmonicida TaxID=348837 RepID=V6LPZ5_9EUKA|nr:hypothetical protein SS50377_27567 [Spironucleus salmonicida]|eukprot:EST46655.1 Hypothetical protein SS50377_13460 [Spironucleus salmonicida]